MTFLNPVRHITFDAHDPYAIAEFWSRLTGYKLLDEPGDDEVLIDPERPGVPGLLFIRVPGDKAGKNRVHLDIQPPHGTRDAEVERLGALGARIVDDRAHRGRPGLGRHGRPRGQRILRGARRGGDQARLTRRRGRWADAAVGRARYTVAAATGPVSRTTPSTESAVPLTASTARTAPGRRSHLPSPSTSRATAGNHSST